METDTQPRSYLLRLWPSETDGVFVWRFSLEEIPSGKRIGFVDLVDLAVFIESLTPSEKRTLLDLD